MNILFINSHPISTGCTQDSIFLIKKPLFDVVFFLPLQTGMIKFCCSFTISSIQFLSHIFCSAASSAKNYHRTWFSFCKNKCRRFFCRYFLNIIMNVRSVAVTSHNMSFAIKKNLSYAGKNFRRSRCCKSRYNRNIQFF